MLRLMMARAHAAGGEPLSAMPHALSAMALAEKASLLGLHARAALELVAVQLNVDAQCVLACPMSENGLVRPVPSWPLVV